MPEPTSISLRMTREHLIDIPHIQLPDDFSFRLYQPGDEKAWLNIWRATGTINEIDIETFERTYFGDTKSLAERLYFIIDSEGKPIATSTAWFGENDHSQLELGRVHWVAIIPDMQGRGLGRPLLSKTLYCLRELGHGNAFLYTDTLRISAIALYLKFGFEPDIQSEEDRQAWLSVQHQLRPDIATLVSDYLA